MSKIDAFTIRHSAKSGLEFSRVVPDKLEANSESIRHTKVELYVEKITFSPGK